jgi:hypothetical protein
MVMVEFGPIRLLVWLLYGGGVGGKTFPTPFVGEARGASCMAPITVFTFEKRKYHSCSLYFSRFYIVLESHIYNEVNLVERPSNTIVHAGGNIGAVTH